MNIEFLDSRFGAECQNMVRPVVRGFYKDGSPCIGLVDAKTSEPWATCTVYLAERPSAGSIFIKDYSENEGMVDLLLENGVIQETPVGFVNGVREYRMTDAVRFMVDEARNAKVAA